MTFKKTFGLVENSNMSVNSRTSVKILDEIENEYLMLSTNRGDLEFPGGKIEVGERREAAVKRELLEETGYEVSGPIEYLGHIISRRKDRFEDHKVYKASIYFYKCNITYKTDELVLSERERKFNPIPIILEKEEIIETNEKNALKNPNESVIAEITDFVLNAFN